MACDDAVLAETSSPRAYAECLAHMAQKSFVRRSLDLAQAAVGRIRQTSLRVAQILDVNRPRSGVGVWKPAVSLVAVFAFVCSVGSARAPRLIAFQDSSPAKALPVRSPAPMIASALSPSRAEAASAPLTPSLIHAAEWRRSAPARRDLVARARMKAPKVTPVGVVPAFERIETFETSFVLQQSLPPQNLKPSSLAQSAVGTQDLVHNAGLRGAPLASTEAVFVVVQSQYGSTGPSLYQISVWRVIVRQPENPAGKTLPRKET